jgi:hypothetical protein
VNDDLDVPGFPLRVPGLKDGVKRGSARASPPGICRDNRAWAMVMAWAPVNGMDHAA